MEIVLISLLNFLLEVSSNWQKINVGDFFISVETKKHPPIHSKLRKYFFKTIEIKNIPKL